MSGKKSTLVVLERPEVREEQPPKAEADEDVSLEEIFRIIGYPESWARMTRESMAAKGKTFRWERVDRRWETEL